MQPGHCTWQARLRWWGSVRMLSDLCSGSWTLVAILEAGSRDKSWEASRLIKAATEITQGKSESTSSSYVSRALCQNRTQQPVRVCTHVHVGEQDGISSYSVRDKNFLKQWQSWAWMTMITSKGPGQKTQEFHIYEFSDPSVSCWAAQAGTQEHGQDCHRYSVSWIRGHGNGQP